MIREVLTMSFRFCARRLPLIALSAGLGLISLSAPSAQAFPFFGKKPEAASKTQAAKGSARGQASKTTLAEAPSSPASAAEQSAPAKPATAKERQAARSLDMVNQASFWLGELEKNPADDEAALEGSIALRRIGSSERAIQLAAMGLQVKGESPQLWGALALGLVASGENQPALQALQKAVSLNPKDPNLQSALGVIYDRLERADLAAPAYEAALKLAPEDATILSNYGLSIAMTGDLKKAEDMLRRANQSPLAPPQARQNLALVVGLQGRFEESERLATRDLPPAVASENVAYLKAMLNGGENRWSQLRQEKTN
ncbi:tetratricopeptide repeat protein [Aquidulcibacter sp.]|uniref:tetratricopeptide repeat protein n=1 Tax=Aquidulcibacter sp. TaxID=2052990 RepID=UPI0037C0CBDF